MKNQNWIILLFSIAFLWAGITQAQEAKRSQTDGSFVNFGGHAFAGSFPIDKANVYLYIVDGEMLFPFDTTTIDTLGFYYFYQVEVGKYLVKIDPVSTSAFYQLYLPTYYGNALLWDDSQIIELVETGWEYDIHLISATSGQITGNGQIYGAVYFIYKNPFENPAPNIEIILQDENYNTVSYLHSGDQGHFSFNDLELKTYYIQPEVTGLDAAPKLITLNETSPIYGDLNILIDINEVVYSIDEPQWKQIKHLSDVFPNPSGDIIQFTLELAEPTPVYILITDLQGRIVYKEIQDRAAGNHLVSVNTVPLNRGVYSLQVSTISTFGLSRKFLKVF